MAPAPIPTIRKAIETSDVQIELNNEDSTSTQERAKIKQASRIANRKVELNKRSARDIYKTEKQNNNLSSPLLLKLAKQAGSEGDLEFMFKMMKTVDAKLNEKYQPNTPKIFKSFRTRRSKSLDLSGEQYSNEIGEQLRELQQNYDEKKLKKKQFREETDKVFEMFYNPTGESQRIMKELMTAEKAEKVKRKSEKKQMKRQAVDALDMFCNPTPETQQVIKDIMRAEKETKAQQKAETKANKQEAVDIFDMFYNPTPESQKIIKEMIKKEKEEKAKLKAEEKAKLKAEKKAEKNAAQGGRSRRSSFFSHLKSELTSTTRALDLATSKGPTATPASTFPTMPKSKETKPHIPHMTKRNVYCGTNAQTVDAYDYSPLVTGDYDDDDLDLYGAPVVEPVSYLGRNAPMGIPVASTSSKNPFESSLI